MVDVDGHLIEYLPALAGYLREEGVDPADPSIQRLLPGRFGPDVDWYGASPEDRARLRIARPPWWGAPARNTRDLATALFPSLLHERLDELGIDVSVVYPSMGLVFLHLEDADERTGACRALNRYCRSSSTPTATAWCPWPPSRCTRPRRPSPSSITPWGRSASRPCCSPGTCSDRSRAVSADAAPWARWIDTYGLDSAYDYDPVWARCRELKVAVAFHSGSIGWGSRVSMSNYMLNHIGHLAEGQHALAKSLFLGGVTRRFPELRFAFLEGGVAWAAALYADIVGHWEKRNRNAMAHLDPSGIDRAVLLELVGGLRPRRRHRPRPQHPPPPHGGPRPPRRVRGLWHRGRRGHRRALRRPVLLRLRGRRPDGAHGLQHRRPTRSARGCKAMFGSDIAHWDVPDMAEVLGEACELVEHGLIDDDDFRDFIFTNPVRFYTDVNPDFFEGTVVADAVRDLNGAAVSHDLVVRGGMVVDGTGAPGRVADVGVRDGRIVAIGTVDDDGVETIDATGRVVAPGSSTSTPTTTPSSCGTPRRRRRRCTA